jgi:hypothetical protein
VRFLGCDFWGAISGVRFLGCDFWGAVSRVRFLRCGFWDVVFRMRFLGCEGEGVKEGGVKEGVRYNDTSRGGEGLMHIKSNNIVICSLSLTYLHSLLRRGWR